MSEDDIKPVKSIIDQAKGEYKTIQEKLSVDTDGVLNQIASAGWVVNLLIDLHEEFLRRYRRAKREQNVLDFSDLEHLCLQLLGSKGEPSEVALQLRQKYRYILVDEYQDISPVQEEVLQRISRGGQEGQGAAGGNLFMVGDVKQSIYGFRQAEPRIFLEKYQQFTPSEPKEGQADNLPVQARIALNRNFRSRRGIIEGINYIFSRCMTREFGGIDYQREAQLIYGANYYDGDDSQADGSAAQEIEPIELHLIERDISETGPIKANDDENAEQAESGGDIELPDLDVTRREAVIVARRIRKMVGADRSDGKAEFDIIDPQSTQVRPVQYRDIVILLRSMKHRAELWSEIFHKMGVPIRAELSSGYFVATEIQDMISLLKLLDNPQQDIPLAAVLRSPLVGLNEVQLVAVRLHTPEAPFYQALCRYVDSGADERLREKLQEFLSRLESWRDLARRGGLAGLIWQIYRDSNLPAYVSGLKNGRQRYRNLLHLHDRARQFDSFAGRGLTRFLRFIEKLRAEEGDFGPAPVLTEADNVVRIMSVHKSKGLEFPVVIVADLARRFNISDTRQSILFDRPDVCGVGLHVVDSISRQRWSTVAHNVVAENLQQQTLTEEMRILYVALTRARERLLMVASLNLDRFGSQGQSWRFEKTVGLPEFVLSSAKAPTDWLATAWASHRDLYEFFAEDNDTPEASTKVGSGPSRFALTTYLSGEVKKIINTAQLIPARDETDKSLITKVSREEPVVLCPSAKSVIDRMNWRYKHQSLTTTAGRTSVTELKRQMDTEYEPDFIPAKFSPGYVVPTGEQIRAETFQLRPRFMSEQPQEPSTAEKGTWTHLFLQRLDLDESLEEPQLRKQLEGMVKSGIFSEQQSRCIDLGRIARFFVVPLGKQLLTHRDNLKREWDFTLALPVSEIYPDDNLSEVDRHEPVLVRGIIDCFFQTEAGVVVIDFKTDSISESQSTQRAQSYAPQMHFYRRAIENILGKKVNEMYVYFLNPGVAVGM